MLALAPLVPPQGSVGAFAANAEPEQPGPEEQPSFFTTEDDARAHSSGSWLSNMFPGYDSSGANAAGDKLHASNGATGDASANSGASEITAATGFSSRNSWFDQWP